MAPASVGGGERLRALDKSRFSCFPFEDFAILWVVNDKGEILIALEEGILAEQDGGSISFPLPKNLASAYSKLGQAPIYSKLGHPALVGCQPARIAGEIICDLDENRSLWYINNRSGRYGVNVGRHASAIGERGSSVRAIRNPTPTRLHMRIMASIFEYDRLTPSRSRKIAEAIHSDRRAAESFTEKTLDRLAKLIPKEGNFPAEHLEEAFLIAVEVRKIFNAAELNIWDFFPTFPNLEERSLLGHVFISAVEGRPLREIIGDIQRREGRMDAGEFLFNATAFKKSQVGSDLAGRISAQLLQTATKKQ
jgi:hypothetical protein